MKKLAIVLILLSATTIGSASAQSYVKLNGLYAMVGVINPAVEFAISPKSTVQIEFIASPWKTINGNHATFGIFMGEYRRYFRGHNDGWYLGLNAGMMAFDLTKPYLEGGKIKLKDSYSKGYGFMFGACVGYEWQFRERWLLDAFFGFSWMTSFYNGYRFSGEIEMYPHRPIMPKYPDPFNGSSEWLPNKIGISIGYRIISPKRARGGLN